ncbi:hypothetical protein CAPTEDRAFT_211919 [Capitella teleta]|uniref:Condensation domain-containing protein n=1 Tax=Capitella teleta TaxID=283909 RepID=R7UDM1_CAPTE|nr:hypothetical protein CAPTEDRAFT_211919 [Capitella teleta]|eukprot:ELU04470.1 hypothetical protein CAPTEDRAFT_211919 [Capitella teleta]
MDRVLSAVAALVAGGCVVLLLQWNKRRRRLTRSVAQSEGPMSRELDPGLETAMYRMGKKGCLNLCNALFFSTKEVLKEETILLALKRIGLRHPLCRMKITEEADGRCVFREMETYAVDFSVSQSSDWITEFERQMKTPWSADKGPMWRAVWMPQVPTTYTTESHPFQTVLLFGFNHAIVDGTSYCKIFNEFIDDLEAIHHGDTAQPLSQPLPPGQRNPWVAAKGEVSDVNPECESKTSVIPLELDKDLTQKLIQKSKAKGATLQGTFQVASMAAMAEVLDCSLDGLRWSSLVTVNLRRVHPEKLDSQHVVPYFGGLNSSYLLPPNWKDKFWQCAREVSESLHDDLPGAIQRTMEGWAFQHMCGISPAMLTLNGSRTENYMAFTNLGNCNYLNRPDENVVQLKARFGGSAEHERGHTTASNIMTLQGRIC